MQLHYQYKCVSKLFHTDMQTEREGEKKSDREKGFSYFHRSKKRNLKVTSDTECTDQVHYNRLQQ